MILFAISLLVCLFVLCYFVWFVMWLFVAGLIVFQLFGSVFLCFVIVVLYIVWFNSVFAYEDALMFI